ncbi:HvfC/BufC N-terminal domain-containing protein [Bordetella trematum]|uniref:HvfC/BufC N-terminal domain-containing protein n=1 Tax=Bordetella trematum TaxID=123899 RepID=UPI00155888C0|nr:DNA-binding domain-containing protein [Bordetella trematum]
MSAGFFDYVRGRSEIIPAGYDPAGMRAYRHLVYVGVSQMLDGAFPALRGGLGEAAWRLLIKAFIRQSAWSSPYYGDLCDAFLEFVARESR